MRTITIFTVVIAALFNVSLALNHEKTLKTIRKATLYRRDALESVNGIPIVGEKVAQTAESVPLEDVSLDKIPVVGNLLAAEKRDGLTDTDSIFGVLDPILKPLDEKVSDPSLDGSI